MKISLSLFSSNEKELEPLLAKAVSFERSGAHYIHLDYRYDVEPPIMMSQLSSLREKTSLPLDVHLITPEITPKTIQQLNNEKIELCSVQLEELEDAEELILGKHFRGHWGVAVNTDTPVESISPHAKYVSFINLMATVPGKSGCAFDPKNFSKIQQVRDLFPLMKIQVDGGVNYEIGRAVRTAKVDIAVSGSYVVHSQTYVERIIGLGIGEVPGSIAVRSVMVPRNSVSIVPATATFQEIIRAISKGKMGMVIVTDKEYVLRGIVTDGDVRKAFEQYQENVVSTTAEMIMNSSPFVADAREPLNSLFHRLSGSRRGIFVIPVCDKSKVVLGAVDLHDTFGGY